MENNPLLNYDEQQRTAYLVFLASVATADHESSEGEIAFMQQMCSMSQLSGASMQQVSDAMSNPSGVNYTTHIDALKGSELKYSLVTDVINMLQADGDTDEAELAHVKRLNAALEISDEQFNVMQQYVQKANAQAASQEGTPGLLGFMGGNSSEGGGIGDLLGKAAGFLASSGLLNQFQQAGIPTNNFQSGSTIGTILSGLAGNLIQSQLGGGGNAGGNSGGGLLGGLMSAAAGAMAGGGQTGGNAGGGLGGLLGSVLSSQGGQNALGGLLNQVMGGNQKGSGLPNLASILGGGGAPAQQSGMGGLMDMLLK